ncbi:MAG: rhodanese-like domain-containing protein [Bacteroides sp.]|nr:rhodanese-like domain-containing protein [Bacteroides sp.]MCM1550328.1 rhodanese-like domain-containing protein [Clostridium sp.]
MVKVIPTIENINIRHIIQKAVAENAIIIDVRSREEFCRGHIPMAINVTLPEIQNGKINFPKGRALIFYCDSGASSIKAARILAEYGYRTINAVGGIRQYDKELTISRQ